MRTRAGSARSGTDWLKARLPAILNLCRGADRGMSIRERAVTI